MNSTVTTNDRSFRFFIFYIMHYMAFSTYYMYMPLYVKSLGFSVIQLGEISGVVAILTIVSNFFWGLICDKSKYKNTPLKLVHILSVVVLMILAYLKSYYLVLFCLSVYAFVQSAIFSITTSMALEYAKDTKFKFGFIRMGGTLGFCIAALVSGYFIKSDMKYFFIIPCLLIPISLIYTMTLPKIEGHQSAGNKMSYLALFKDKRLNKMLIYSGIAFVTISFFNSFFPVHLTNLGAASDIIGWSSFIGAFAEIPFLLLSSRIVKKIGLKNTIFLGGLMCSIRWLLIGVTGNYAVLLVLQAIHGISSIVLMYSVPLYIDRIVPPELKASGQSLYYIVNIGIASSIGGYLGGFLSDKLGIGKVFVIFSIVLVAATAAFAIMSMRAKDEPDLA